MFNTKTYLRIAVLCAGALTFIFWAPIAHGSASFYVSPDSGSFPKDGNFEVSVMVRSDQAINAVRGFLNFPTKYLEVLSIDKNSIINFWVQPPSFSNAGDTGNVYFEGAILNPGYRGDGGKILEVTFRVKDMGSAELYFSDFSILANDGKGTNVSVPNGSAKFTLTEVKAVPAPPTPVALSDLNRVEEKINTVQEKVNDLSDVVPTHGVLYWWNTFPNWVKVGAVILIGAAAFALALLILSFGILITVWILGNIWRRRGLIFYLGRKIPERADESIKKTSSLGKKIGEEIQGDVKYAANQFKSNLKESSGEVPFSKLLEDLMSSAKRTVKRFTTWNGE